MATRVAVDQKALRLHLRSLEPQAALDTAAEALVSRIEDESPVNTGDYQDSIRWRRFPLSRRIFSVDPFAHLVEWGSIKNLAYAPFRRSALGLGFMLRENDKTITFEAGA